MSLPVARVSSYLTVVCRGAICGCDHVVQIAPAPADAARPHRDRASILADLEHCIPIGSTSDSRVVLSADAEGVAVVLDGCFSGDHDGSCIERALRGLRLEPNDAERVYLGLSRRNDQIGPGVPAPCESCARTSSPTSRDRTAAGADGATADQERERCISSP